MEQKSERLPVFTERFRQLQGKQSNTEFAEFLGISRQSVGFYLNGDRIPDAVTLIKIAEKCDVSSDWLLGLSNVQDRSAELQQVCNYTGLSSHAVRNLHILSSLDGEYPAVKLFSIRLINETAENSGPIFNSLAWKAGLSELNRLQTERLNKTDGDFIAGMIADTFEEKNERTNGMVRIPARDAALFYHDETANYVRIIAAKVLDEYVEAYVKNASNPKHTETVETTP
ncbi:MAG: helix-turn-helix transcriptional regulator [Oscillibacter sp.]|nr:helix-turn-helix transcriptional regulator [Oscillibacter sp.]